jgi:predicted lysophospholipase L1 biosynthesis ABC-type transport system permease subunit
MADGYAARSLDSIVAIADACQLYLREEITDERYIATLKALGVDHETAVTKCMAIDSVRARR